MTVVRAAPCPTHSGPDVYGKRLVERRSARRARRACHPAEEPRRLRGLAVRDERGRHLRQQARRENSVPASRKREAETAELSGIRITQGLFAGQVPKLIGLEMIQFVRERETRVDDSQRRECGSENCQEDLSTACVHCSTAQLGQSGAGA